MPSGLFVPSPPATRSTWWDRLPAPSSTPRSSCHRLAAHAVAIGARTSPGVRHSPSAHATEGARMARRFQPPARSVPGESHPFDVLLRPSSGRACFIPSYAPGVHPIAAASPRPFGPSRGIGPTRSRDSSRPPLFRTPELRSGVPLQGFLPSHGCPSLSPGLPPLHF